MSAPSANGFTLIDMLAALLILALAMAGLGQGMYALARLQGATNRNALAASQMRSLDASLDRLLSRTLPDSLAGDAEQLTGSCGAVACSARLETEGDEVQTLLIDSPWGPSALLLPKSGSHRLVYLSDHGPLAEWPIPNRRLVGVQIESADRRVLAYHRIRRHQPLDCALDPVSQSCPTRP